MTIALLSGVNTVGCDRFTTLLLPLVLQHKQEGIDGLRHRKLANQTKLSQIIPEGVKLGERSPKEGKRSQGCSEILFSQHKEALLYTQNLLCVSRMQRHCNSIRRPDPHCTAAYS
jgi:hypothetical protein